jgi:hypothetical protein
MKNSDVYLVLRDTNQVEVRGRLLTVETAIEDGRVCVMFDGADRPLLPVTERVEVELQSAALSQAARGSARVLQHRIGSEACFYVLELPQPCRTALASLFERRVSERVSLPDPAPIEATLSALDGSLGRKVAIKDLSAGGAGLLLQPPEDLELLAQVGMRLSFTLPGQEAPTEVEVHLASRRPSGAEVLYGVAYESATIGQSARAVERIREWVAQRSASGTQRTAV